MDLALDWLRDFLTQLIAIDALSSPITFAGLAMLAIFFLWLAFGPSRGEAAETGRLSGYLNGRDVLEEHDLRQSFLRRAVAPAIHGILKTLSGLTPAKSVARVQQLLVEAGEPAGITAPDLLGMQMLAGIIPVAIYLLAIYFANQLTVVAPPILLRNSMVLLAVGFVMPRLWLRGKANTRRREIISHFSDALDLLSVSVDAGLGLDAAIVRVCERWSNALTQEMQRATLEIRVGTPRNVALQRMADRTGVQELETFVGVLIQSSELGVSIAETLHAQAAQVRVRRRQRSEELARQASVKMVFALVFFIFPALLVVLLGPGVPRIFEALSGVGNGAGFP